MDFRTTHCAWCSLRKEPIDACKNCPKYLKYFMHENIILNSDVFCSICAHVNVRENHGFCTTNRLYQEDSDEPFECYKFRPVWHQTDEIPCKRK